VNALVELSEDISEVLPYLNTVLKGFQYSDGEKILTVKRKGHLITFRRQQIAITKLEDEKEAREVMEELKQGVNETYENKDHIKPTYTSKSVPDLLRFLSCFQERIVKSVGCRPALLLPSN
jgi:ArsR family metal-binding transcriptional regulator